MEQGTPKSINLIGTNKQTKKDQKPYFGTVNFYNNNNNNNDNNNNNNNNDDNLEISICDIFNIRQRTRSFCCLTYNTQLSNLVQLHDWCQQ